MSIEEIKAAVARKPFRSFTLNTVDGRSMVITEESEVLLPSKKPNLVIVFEADGAMHLLEAEALASITSV
jgi:hypothetical protein